MEKQANLLAACLLLPEPLLEYSLQRFRFQPTPESIRTPTLHEKERLKTVADYLGVSLTTLRIRLWYRNMARAKPTGVGNRPTHGHEERSTKIEYNES